LEEKNKNPGIEKNLEDTWLGARKRRYRSRRVALKARMGEDRGSLGDLGLQEERRKTGNSKAMWTGDAVESGARRMFKRFAAYIWSTDKGANLTRYMSCYQEQLPVD
jgi:hypothetical protein